MSFWSVWADLPKPHLRVLFLGFSCSKQASHRVNYDKHPSLGLHPKALADIIYRAMTTNTIQIRQLFCMSPWTGYFQGSHCFSRTSSDHIIRKTVLHLTFKLKTHLISFMSDGMPICMQNCFLKIFVCRAEGTYSSYTINVHKQVWILGLRFLSVLVLWWRVKCSLHSTKPISFLAHFSCTIEQ